MKTYKNLYEKCINKELIKTAIIDASKGKSKRREVISINKNINNYINYAYNMLKNKSYIPKNCANEIIIENSNGKKRVIKKVDFSDQIVHHILISVLKPVFMKGMYGLSCGSIPQRGIHYGKKFIEKWVRTDYKNTKYCCQMDIHHFYQSINHEKLKECLGKKIKDKDMMKILCDIIGSCDEGIPLGYYTSQWFANYFLQELDHYIKENLRVKYYIRYIDDMVIFGSNKRKLHEDRKAIENYLNNILFLQMKSNWQVLEPYIQIRMEKKRGEP